ncbi:MAG: FecR domain-containing protein [Gammaproteobacteria bacterium]
MSTSFIGHTMRATLLFVAAAVALPPVYAATAAGEVVKVVGRASAATADGDLRRLDQGQPVNTGDTVITATSSFARIKLSDGGYVVLRPNTRFQIADYHYAEKPEESRSVFSLLKGGFRAVTGLIGQRNHSAVSYRTAVATIGIRGTDLEVIDCTDGCPDLGTNVQQGLYFKVHQGGIAVNDTPFDQGKGGFAQMGIDPVEIDFADPANPLNSDPTPAANPEDCF